MLARTVDEAGYAVWAAGSKPTTQCYIRQKGNKSRPKKERAGQKQKMIQNEETENQLYVAEVKRFPSVSLRTVPVVLTNGDKRMKVNALLD